MSQQLKQRDPAEHRPNPVWCLLIDLIKSTPFASQLSTELIDNFNIVMAEEQMTPHLTYLELGSVLLKFTGDGWLLMTDEKEKWPALCCLATIMANTFQKEMSKLTTIPVGQIPNLRLSICSGRDIPVTLPDCHVDWVGDSARKANRASKCCLPNEIIIDAFVRDWIYHDFETKPVDMNVHSKDCEPKEGEEPFPLYVLGELKPQSVEFRAPGYFIYTLKTIGKIREATAFGEEVFKYLGSEAAKPSVDKKALLYSLNRLMASVPDYPAALEIMKKMQALGIRPNVVTYSTLMTKALDYKKAMDIFKEMCESQLQPDDVAYNTLIKKAPYEKALEIADEMKREHIRFSAYTYNTLINKSPDYDTATDLVGRMRESGISPDVITYNTLIAKVTDEDTIHGLLAEMYIDGIRPTIRTYNALINRATDREEYNALVRAMAAQHILPNVFTYNILIAKAPDYETAKDVKQRMRQEDIQPDVVTYNTLIAKAPDFEKAKVLIKEMKKQKIQLDVVTYSTLIAKAPDFEKAKVLIKEMKKQKIQLDVVTYNTLIAKAPDFEKAKALIKEMKKQKIQLDVVTYNTLIAKAPDFEKAKALVEEMDKRNIQPNFATYATLFSKDLTHKSADDILVWFVHCKDHPEGAIGTAISSFRRIDRIDQALRLSLDYAHLPEARELIRDYPDEALSYFEPVYGDDPEHPNAAHSLGIAYMELGNYQEAKNYLRKARKLATADARKAAIGRWLDEIDRKSQER